MSSKHIIFVVISYAQQLNLWPQWRLTHDI